MTTRFAVHSFVCIGIMTTALWFIVSQYLVNSLLEREWETTAQFIRTDVMEFLTAEDFKTKDRKSVGYKFEKLLHHLTLIPEILRFKVYNPQGVVLWSDDKRLVGQSFPDNDELQAAIGGEVVADMSSLDKKENVFEHGSAERAVELYVPIYSSGAPRELLGVFEIYKRADLIYRDIRKARIVVLLGALSGGLLLHLSLFAIVRQAAGKINEQQENLLKVQTDLAASQRMAAVGEMAAAVAHGIGNPLSSIRATAQVAKLDCAECEGQSLQQKTLKTLDGIIQQVDRVQKRMQGLLNFAKPMEPHLAPVEINSLLRDIVDVLQSRFVEAGVSPYLELDRTLPKIRVDANQLEQVFMGLITNALEAAPPGGRVTVSSCRLNGEAATPGIRVAIEDTGEGIPVENRERIFEPFFTTKAHGTGIGLPLAKKFVERNGGNILVANRREGGARFEVVFPTNRGPV